MVEEPTATAGGGDSDSDEEEDAEGDVTERQPPDKVSIEVDGGCSIGIKSNVLIQLQ